MFATRIKEYIDLGNIQSYSDNWKIYLYMINIITGFISKIIVLCNAMAFMLDTPIFYFEFLSNSHAWFFSHSKRKLCLKQILFLFESFARYCP